MRIFWTVSAIFVFIFLLGLTGLFIIERKIEWKSMTKRERFISGLLGIVAVILFVLLPYEWKKSLLLCYTVWLVIYLWSQWRERSNEIKELKKIIAYLEDKFGLFEKMSGKEDIYENCSGFEEIGIRSGFKGVIKERIKWHSLQKGMSQSEVNRIFGEALRENVSCNGSGSDWHYEDGEIYFDRDNKVTGWFDNFRESLELK